MALTPSEYFVYFPIPNSNHTHSSDSFEKFPFPGEQRDVNSHRSCQQPPVTSATQPPGTAHTYASLSPNHIQTLASPVYSISCCPSHLLHLVQVVPSGPLRLNEKNLSILVMCSLLVKASTEICSMFVLTALFRPQLIQYTFLLQLSTLPLCALLLSPRMERFLWSSKTTLLTVNVHQLCRHAVENLQDTDTMTLCVIAMK